MPKLIKANLLTDVTNTYDQTKTTIAGRVFQKTISGDSCLGAPLSNYIDVFTDTAGAGSIIPAGPMHLTSNGRLFVLSTIAAGVGQVVLYNFDFTGQTAPAYVGLIRYSMPNTAATTHTIRGFKVDDTNTSNIRIFIATTGSVAINGGLFMINKVTLTDFVPVGPSTIAMGTGSDQKAVYQINGAGFSGTTNNTTQAAGVLLDTASTKVYLHNGVAATHQYHIYDYSTVPNNVGQTVTSFTIATPGKINVTGHGYAANDPIVLSTTGTLPTGITAGTVYFVRNPTANDFEVSATTGGASIAFTGADSGTATVRRAFGQSSTMTYTATGNLPALTGTLLLTNSEDLYTPSSGPNSGNTCVVFGTTTNAYEGRISELTAAATAWASLRAVNLLGGSLNIITPTAQYLQVSGTTQDIVYVTANAQFVSKPFQSSVINDVFGSYVNAVLEANPMVTANFGLNTVVGVERRNGWLLASSTLTQQRVISYMDYYSDNRFDYSYIISPVITLDKGTLVDVRSIEALFDLTAPNSFYYRTSGFGSASGGWTTISTAEDLQNLAISADEIQFKITFEIVNQSTSTPSQIIDLFIEAVGLNEISSNWVGSVDNSSASGASPSYTAFRLVKAYTSSVPTLYFRAYDDSGTLVASANTTSNPSSFQYTTNNGASWNNLGTIPNTINTTEVRYAWASPPGVKVTCSIRES